VCHDFSSQLIPDVEGEIVCGAFAQRLKGHVFAESEQATAGLQVRRQSAACACFGFVKSKATVLCSVDHRIVKVLRLDL